MLSHFYLFIVLFFLHWKTDFIIADEEAFVLEIIFFPSKSNCTNTPWFFQWQFRSEILAQAFVRLGINFPFEYNQIVCSLEFDTVLQNINSNRDTGTDEILPESIALKPGDTEVEQFPVI